MADHRKLATILSIDVAGYSRSAEKDQAQAAAAVKALREAAAEIAEPLGGRIFSTAGDGLMLEFPAASSGVQAAMAILAATKSGARALPAVRIGVHLGEVIVADNGDLLGHGVNVAARLQQLAESGQALVSETVRAQVQSAAAIPFAAQGRVQLDKMAEKIGVFRLGVGEPQGFLNLSKIEKKRMGGFMLPALAVALLAVLAAVMAWPRASAPPVLAVLPFATAEDSPAAQRFANAFSTELHDVLSRGGDGLTLMGYATSSGFRADPQPVAAVRKALNVTHVLDGALRQTDDRIEATVELIDARSGAQVWREQFQDDLANLYPMQVRIAKRMREMLRISASSSGEAQSIDPNALRLYMSALGADTVLPDADGWRDRIDTLERAVAIQPDFARAWYQLTFAYSNYRYVAPTQALRLQALQGGKRAAERYLALAPTEARAHYWAAEFEPDARRRTQLLQESLRLGPNDPEVLSLWSLYLTGAGRSEDGFRMASQAATLDPYSDFVVSRQAWRAMALAQPTSAELILSDDSVRLRAMPERWAWVAMGWLAQGQIDRAETALKRLQDSIPTAAPIQADARTPAMLDIQIGRALQALVTTAIASAKNPAAKRAAQARIDALEADASAIPATLFFEHLAFVALVGGPDRAFSLWDKRLAAMPPQEATAVNPDPETSEAFISWPYNALKPLHDDPRFFAYLARYPILKKEPYPNPAGEENSLLALMANRAPDFCSAPGFGYDCAQQLKQALAQ